MARIARRRGCEGSIGGHLAAADEPVFRAGVVPSNRGAVLDSHAPPLLPVAAATQRPANGVSLEHCEVL
jgi:hypothetical protein